MFTSFNLPMFCKGKRRHVANSKGATFLITYADLNIKMAVRSRPAPVQPAEKTSAVQETEHVEMAVRSRSAPVQPAKKISAVQETEHVEKFKPNGNEKSKQKQNSRKQEMRTNTKTIKKSVIGNESSQEKQGKESENVTCTSKAEQPSVSSPGKKTADSNEQEQADLNEVIGNEMATKSIGESCSTNNKKKSKRSGRKGKDRRRANENKAVDISGFDTKQISLPTGMQNLGNTCYFNAVMQNLNQSFLLRELLSEQTSDLPLTKSMIEFYEQMSRRSNKSFNPSSLFQSLCSRSPRFKGGNQQDSHELLRHILDGLRNEEREASPEPEKRKILTKVDKVFGGHFMTVYTCNRCKRPYHICEPFLDISLPVEHQEYVDDVDSESYEEDYEEDITQKQTADHELSYQSAAKTLMTPLNTQDNQDTQRSRSSTKGSGSSLPGSKRKSNDHDPKTSRPRKRSRNESRSVLDFLGVFTRMECIAKEYLCMACHEERVSRGETDYEMTSATKRTLVFNPPALLTLHLKRFIQTANGFVKCNDMITFPDMLDLSPYCSSMCMRNDGNEKNIWYSLYGVVAHDGALSKGHYYAYVKIRKPDDNIREFLQKSFLDRQQLTETKLIEMVNETQIHLNQTPRRERRPEATVKGTWFYISDCQCHEAPKSEVQRSPAYLLFYERMPQLDAAIYSSVAEESNS